MAGEDFERCWQIMPSIEAKQQLLAVVASMYPHAKDDWRNKYHRSLHGMSENLSKPVDDPNSIDQLASLLTRGGS